MQLNGIYALKVSADDLAVILDALAIQPYNKVAQLIANLAAQINAREPEEKAQEG